MHTFYSNHSLFSSILHTDNAVMTYFILVVATFVTSVISGVLSMAGGIILMGVFGLFLTVPAAMVLHGIAQAVSNGSRVWLYRHHIRWGVLKYYSVGALAVLATFAYLQFIPNIGLVFLLIGSFPFLALSLPKSINLDMTIPRVSFSAGIAVTTAQMLAGASGPVLDIFYVQSQMNKEEVLGTKALTQTLGHLLKLFYYGAILAVAADSVPLWLVPTVVVAAITGNYLASRIVIYMTDTQFRRIGRYVILLIGAIYMVKGFVELF